MCIYICTHICIHVFIYIHVYIYSGYTYTLYIYRESQDIYVYKSTLTQRLNSVLLHMAHILEKLIRKGAL